MQTSAVEMLIGPAIKARDIASSSFTRYSIIDLRNCSVGHCRTLCLSTTVNSSLLKLDGVHTQPNKAVQGFSKTLSAVRDPVTFYLLSDETNCHMNPGSIQRCRHLAHVDTGDLFSSTEMPSRPYRSGLPAATAALRPPAHGRTTTSWAPLQATYLHHHHTYRGKSLSPEL